ncbi:MAG: flagellar protein export ATPase FliI [Bacillota bacterium]
MMPVAQLHESLAKAELYTRLGRVAQVTGLIIESAGPRVKLGELCTVEKEDGSVLLAEAVGFRGERVLLTPLGELEGISPGCVVKAAGRPMTVGVGMELLGRVVDAFGQPIDGGRPVRAEAWYPAMRPAPDPLTRLPITEPLQVGVRAIDGLLTCGKGQRIGIFSGSGVGKSTLLGMIARNTSAQVNVVALVGERGREVRDFIQKDLGEEGLKRSVVVVATSDKPPMVRIKAAFTATAIAEYFRDLGMDVLLMMDSVTRFAMAQREVGLATGEPPTTRGYTPSVFALLPRLLERSGTAERGSITGFYTVLVDGDDMNEPIADAVRGILDGHIVLSRQLASKGHYPPIDVLASVSRLMISVVNGEHMELARKVRTVLATYKDAEDLINIGAYVSGSNPDIDYAVKMIKPVTEFLQQGIREKSSLQECTQWLRRMFSQ